MGEAVTLFKVVVSPECAWVAAAAVRFAAVEPLGVRARDEGNLNGVGELLLGTLGKTMVLVNEGDPATAVPARVTVEEAVNTAC
jgi:hypothetical protein